MSTRLGVAWSRYRIAGAAAALVAVALPAASRADLSLYRYSLKSSACATTAAGRSDPISIVFRDRATIGTTLNHLAFHTNWPAPASTALQDQYVRTHGRCLRMDGAIGSGPAYTNRWHIRLRDLPDPTATNGALGDLVAGTPHREQVVRCGSYLGFIPRLNHAVPPADASGSSGFDTGRREVVAKLKQPYGDPVGPQRAPHRVSYEYWGNRRTIRQCNGWLAGSNGWVAVVDVSAQNDIP